MSEARRLAYELSNLRVVATGTSEGDPWHEDGPVQRYACRHIGQAELDQLHERARTNGSEGVIEDMRTLTD